MSSRESFLFEHYFFCTYVVKVTIYIFCILFLFNYIYIDLFIKILNFINDDCKLNLYVSLIMTLIHVCLDPCQWSLMSLITGNKVKKTHKPRYCEKEKDKANKWILRNLSFDNNGLVKPSCGTVALYGPFGFF